MPGKGVLNVVYVDKVNLSSKEGWMSGDGRIPLVLSVIESWIIFSIISLSLSLSSLLLYILDYRPTGRNKCFQFMSILQHYPLYLYQFNDVDIVFIL